MVERSKGKIIALECLLMNIGIPKEGTKFPVIRSDPPPSFLFLERSPFFYNSEDTA